PSRCARPIRMPTRAASASSARNAWRSRCVAPARVRRSWYRWPRTWPSVWHPRRRSPPWRWRACWSNRHRANPATVRRTPHPRRWQPRTKSCRPTSARANERARRRVCLSHSPAVTACSSEGEVDMAEGRFRLVTRSDFDGLVCAVLLKELDLVDDILFVHPKDMQDGKVEINARDITTNLPYV